MKGVSVLGLGLRDAALSYLDAHSMPSGGDWGLGRIAALFVKGTEETTVDSCTFEKLDGNAVLLNKYNRGATIQNSNFHEIGDNMIAQLGETEGVPEAFGMGWDGTKGDQPRGTRILNNFAYRCGLFEKQSSFYFQAKSCQNVIKNNIFFHGPRAGMNFNVRFACAALVCCSFTARPMITFSLPLSLRDVYMLLRFDVSRFTGWLRRRLSARG